MHVSTTPAQESSANQAGRALPQIKSAPIQPGSAPLAMPALNSRRHHNRAEWEPFQAPAKPGTLAFNDEQHARWVTRKASANLVQTSQAPRLQSPVASLAQAVKSTVQWLIGAPSLAGSPISQTIGEMEFTVRKTAALNQLQAQGETTAKLAVGLRESSHDSVAVQDGITAWMGKHFRAERGDIFLAEAAGVAQYIDGAYVIVSPTLEKHHPLFCHGVPKHSCQFLREPPEAEAVRAAKAETKNLVERMFDFLMNAIAPAKAAAARRQLANYHAQSSKSDTNFKTRLLIEYQDYCPPSMQARLEKRVDALSAAVKKEKDAEAAARIARDSSYFEQIVETMKQLKPGAVLYHLMGRDHGNRLESRLDTIAGYVVTMQELTPKKDL